LLARGKNHGPARKAATPKVHEQMTGAQFVRAVLGSTLEQALANASEIAAGSTDEDHVHQLRIGLRRLRTALRELADLDDLIDPAWDKPLADVFARLGELRDNVAAAKTVRPILERARAPKIRWEASTSEVNPGATVRNPAFQATLLALLAFSLRENAGARSPAQLHEYLRTRLTHLHEQIVRAGRHFETLPPQQQHKVRKRLKRLRYLAEFVTPLHLGKAGKHYLARLEPAQDALGDHMDVSVALEKFRHDAEQDSRSEVAAECLQAYLGETARHAHVALKAVAAARPFWRG
jgi:CHAD domain-containing protein